MSGAAPDRKRKRKRKTRAERNLMSRNHHLQGAETQKKNSSKNKKSSEPHPPQNTTYTLRSGKGGALPYLVPKDYVKSTAGLITQGRLTRPLELFTSSRSSEWTEREPETEEMKKKVENDLKRVLNLSGKKSQANGELHKVTTAIINSEDKIVDDSTSLADIQPEVNMEVDTYFPRSQNALETSESSTRKLCNEKGLNSNTSVINEGASITSTVSEISGSPECPEEALYPVPPIQEIADKIMKELKPKFDKLFPNRDIEMEICCDLQKLLKQSACQREEPRNDSNLKQTDVNPGNTAPRGSESQPSLKSTLSACRSFQSTREKRPPHILGSSNSDSSPWATTICHSAPFQVRIQDLNKKKVIKSSLSQNLLLSEDADEDKIIRINMKHDESESSDVEDDSGISIVRYNEFVASARRLEVEVEQQRLRQFNSDSQHLRRHPSQPVDDQVFSCNSKSLHKSSDWRCSQVARALDFKDPKGVFGGVTPSKVNFYHCSSAHHQACSLPDDDSFGYKSKKVSSQNWRCYNAARVLDFSEPKGSSLQHVPMSCPTSSVSHHHSGNHHHSHCQYQPALSSCKSPQLPYNTCDRNVFKKSLDTTVRGPFMSPPGYPKEGVDISKVGPSLAQSRYNFQEALNTACHKSDFKQAKGNGQSFIGHEKMDWQNNQDSGVSFHDKNRSYGSESNSLNAWQLLTRPLSELQTHQADLQKQAKDFLDDLDRSTINQISELPRCQYKHSKHLFRKGSPDSNGSPMWISSCVMKDAGLEASSFI